MTIQQLRAFRVSPLVSCHDFILMTFELFRTSPGALRRNGFMVRREQINLLDIETLIETPLELDAERVATGKASRRRNRNAADSQAAAR